MSTSRLCPKPCGRLATAAIFIVVGVVQFIAGLLLLHSKFVYLLAGPDFWTALSNIAVGCLLGVAASTWKTSKKRNSKKQRIRQNLLASLLTSAILVNGTTALILILGEGNTVLAINLETVGRSSPSTLGSDVLAYAYATSVCSPIVCIVISIVYLSGNCFSKVADKMSKSPRTPNSILKRKDIDFYEWVFTPEGNISLKSSSPRSVSFSSDSALSYEEDNLVPVPRERGPSVCTVENLYTNARRIPSAGGRAMTTDPDDASTPSPAKREMSRHHEVCVVDDLNREVATTTFSTSTPSEGPRSPYTVDTPGSEGDSMFDISGGSESLIAGELVCVRVDRGSPLSETILSKLVPATIPTVPSSNSDRPVKKIKRSKTCLADKFNEPRDSPKFTSFRGDIREKLMWNFSPSNQKVSERKKEFRGRSLHSLPPISEVLFEDHCPIDSSAHTSGYLSSPGECFDVSGSKMSDYFYASKKCTPVKTATRKSLLRKLKSRGQASVMDIRDGIVDPDSLVGLTHEELVERQLRNEFLRKSLQKRLREKTGD